MELTGFMRDAVLSLLEEQEGKSEGPLKNAADRLETLTKEERARAINTVFMDGRLAKYIVLDGIAKGRVVPVRIRELDSDAMPGTLHAFKRSIDIIISQKGATCCKVEVSLAIIHAFTLGRQLIPIEVGGEEFRQAELILAAERMRKARNNVAEKRRQIISAHYGDKLAEKRPSPAQVIKACGGKLAKAGIQCPNERTIRADVAAILKELPRKIKAAGGNT